METKANHVLIGAFTIIVDAAAAAVRAVGGEVLLREAAGTNTRWSSTSR